MLMVLMYTVLTKGEERENNCNRSSLRLYLGNKPQTI